MRPGQIRGRAKTENANPKDSAYWLRPYGAARRERNQEDSGGYFAPIH
jgi:hypothetical protein